VTDLAVIKAKRVDSDEVVEMVLEIAISNTPIGQRMQLTDAVHSLYPNAEFRSFANEAASFLDHKLLIVATYRRGPAEGRGGQTEDAQQSLL
jgi:23S rRNA G2445 N2-methylase RlmL